MSSVNVIADVARILQVSEAVLRLVISLLLNFPLALCYSRTVCNKSAKVKHFAIITSGLSLAFFNFELQEGHYVSYVGPNAFCDADEGAKVVHSMLTVFSNYTLLKLAPGSFATVPLSFILNMGYLMMAYWEVYGEDHDVTWATPQCVLALKMIGLTFDCYDSYRSPKESLSPDQERHKLEAVPSPLEVAGFAYFPSSFLVGPQFSMRQYLDFTDGKFSIANSMQTTVPALKCLLLGIAYCVLLAVLAPLYPTKFLLSEAFQESVFMYKLFVLCLWGEFMRWKYVAVWLLAEGSCIISGLTYNGRDKNNAPLWNGCSNVKLYQLETAITLKEVVESFNCNTNLWVSRYIYKRLRFLGSKLTSQAISLLFISVWHGLYFGYYLAFLLEFFLLMAEMQMQDIVKKTCLAELTGHPVAQIPLFIIKKITVLLILGYALVAFVCLHRQPINKVHSSVYYFGHWCFAWPLLYYGLFKPWLQAKSAHGVMDNSGTAKQTTSEM